MATKTKAETCNKDHRTTTDQLVAQMAKTTQATQDTTTVKELLSVVAMANAAHTVVNVKAQDDLVHDKFKPI